MAKKKKKKKKHNLKNGPPAQPLPVLEKQYQSCIEKKDYKAACSCLNKLLNHDRAKYLSLMIECRKKLFHQCIKQKNIGRAQMELSRLKGVAGDEGVLIEGILFTTVTGDFRQGAQLCKQLLSGTAVDTLDEHERILAADCLVLSFNDNNGADKNNQPLFNDISAIRKALESICEQRYGAALSAIRTVGIHSPAAPWKMLVKGMCAYYTGDDGKACRAFEGVAGESRAKGTARVFLSNLRYNAYIAQNYKNALLLQQLCVLNGHKDMKKILPRAEYLWHSGREKDSYKHLCRTLPSFPPPETGFLNDLAHFYFTVHFAFGENKYERYQEGIFQKIERHGPENKFEFFLLSRLDAITISGEMAYPEEIIDAWERCYDAYRAVYGENNSLHSLVYLQTGKQLEKTRNIEDRYYTDFFFHPRKKKRWTAAYEKAELYYTKAEKLAPGSIEPYLARLNLYEQAQQDAKANRLLDTMVKRFPENKHTLIKAGNRCIDRKAYKKGISYLEKAAGLDHLDSILKEYLIIAYIHYSKKFAKQNRTLYRPFLDKALALGDPGSDHFNRGHAFLYVRWAAFEYLAGYPQAADELLRKSTENNHPPLLVDYFTSLVFYVYGLSYHAEMHKRIKRHLKGKPDIHKALCMQKVIDYFFLLENGPGILRAEIKKLNRYILKLKNITTAPDEIRALLLFYLKNAKNIPDATHLIRKLSKKMISAYPDNPFFRFAFVYSDFDADLYSGSFRSTIEKLDDILNDAEKEQDYELISLVKSPLEMLKKLENIYNFPVPRFDNNNKKFDDLEYYEDNDEDDYEDEELMDYFTGQSQSTGTKPPFVKAKEKQQKKAAETVQTDLFE